MRKLSPGRLVLATHNQGKIDEIRHLIDSHGLTLASARDLNLPEPEEPGLTFRQNAELKARAAMGASGAPSLADDSGLAIVALAGRPGVFTANWSETAGGNRDFGFAMGKIAHALGVLRARDNRATFHSCLCLVHPDGEAVFFEGEVKGTLTFPPRGSGGFGYDPIFVPKGEDRTFGEMSLAEKKKFSHRTRALQKFKAVLP
ncbi:MAG: RdgB/HAM1 family non-canonical purine NTP pyrophosphatase [Pseudomonadota bacterium]